MSGSLGPVHARHSVGPDMGISFLQSCQQMTSRLRVNRYKLLFNAPYTMSTLFFRFLQIKLH